MLITTSLSNSISLVHVLLMQSAAFLTILSQASGSAAQNLGINPFNMLICSSVNAICWLDMQCAVNYHAQQVNSRHTFFQPSDFGLSEQISLLLV